MAFSQADKLHLFVPHVLEQNFPTAAEQETCTYTLTSHERWAFQLGGLTPLPIASIWEALFIITCLKINSS